jgi:4-hydroxybenzoate polyprenyltransferase
LSSRALLQYKGKSCVNQFRNPYKIAAITTCYSKLSSRRTFSSNVSSSWIDNSKIIPSKAKPYLHLARVDKQVGTLLLMWPCFWSVALAAPLGAFPDMFLLAKFAVGAFVMRGAGCTINDLWDRDFDKHVERTKNRPLANGDVTVPQAVTFLALQLSCGLGVLLTFDVNTILLGVASMPLVILYPAMKRFTNWPQLVLGLTFNWGALMGWSAVHGGDLSLTHTLPLYLSGVCWTLVYDTLYGYQDRKDDKSIGECLRWCVL